MGDNFKILAQNLVHYSNNIQPGEKVLIEIAGPEEELAQELIRAVYDAGGTPFLTLKNDLLQKQWLTYASEEQIISQARWEAQRMEEMDAYIGLRVRQNIYEMSDVPAEKRRLYDKLLLEPVHHHIRVAKTKWVILRYPNASMAQEAKMSTEKFRDFYFKVCNLDYQKLSDAMEPLHRLLSQTKQVKILAPGTELVFCVENIGAVKCDGHNNIPDGEVYTAPVRDSVFGEITYNTSSSYSGQVFDNVHLVFKQGKIVEAEAGAKTGELNAILDTDEGARYVGEFAFGLNPYVLSPINDILFDEKINGSFHFTPGACYKEASNGNHSAVHWDLVKILRSEYGGGEIYFDGRLIQKDGLFCIDELLPLNPENLL